MCKVIKNAHLHDLYLFNVKAPFTISQCTTFSGVAGNCNSSLFEIEDVTFETAIGTVLSDPIASLQCSADAPCSNITIQGIDLKLVNGTEASGYNCNSVVNPMGFNCTGSTCEQSSATGSC